ncbi:MAG: magnesium transporter CorA family protein [Candidatus Paceibacterota bacterium]
MISRYTHGDLVWVDLESPNQSEVRKVMEEFSLDPHIAEELLSPSHRPKVDYLKDYIYLILHFPAFRHSHESESNQEVDFVLGKKFIITTHYDTIDPLHKFSKLFEVDSILDRSNMNEHAGFVFFYMIKKLYKAVSHELDYINDSLVDIEKKIFDGYEKEMVVEISKASKELLVFKQALQTHGGVLSSFQIAGEKLYGEDFHYYLMTINNEHYRVSSDVNAGIDTIRELRETNNSLVSTKQNEVMKVLTIMAFVTFPLSLIASIFGMNTEYLPFVGHPQDFWIVMGIMGTATIIFFTFFKHRKWL